MLNSHQGFVPDKSLLNILFYPFSTFPSDPSLRSTLADLGDQLEVISVGKGSW